MLQTTDVCIFTLVMGDRSVIIFNYLQYPQILISMLLYKPMRTAEEKCFMEI